MFLRQLKDDGVLRIVGILILVDEHVPELVGVLLPDLLAVAKQPVGVNHQIVEVHRIALPTTLDILLVDEMRERRHSGCGPRIGIWCGSRTA